jgi:hypothetical protein
MQAFEFVSGFVKEALLLVMLACLWKASIRKV